MTEDCAVMQAKRFVAAMDQYLALMVCMPLTVATIVDYKAIANNRQVLVNILVEIIRTIPNNDATSNKA